MRKRIILLSALLLLICMAVSTAPAWAATFKQSEDTLVIDKGQVINDDLYGAAGNVQMNGTVNGDAFVAGGNIVIDGDVTDDLMVGAGTIFVNGDVGDDVRIGGGTIYVNGNIKGDLFVGGGQVLVSDKATVGGSVVVGSGNLQVHAPVGKDLLAGSGSVELNSTVGRNVKISGEDVKLGSDAKIGGNLLTIGKNKPKMASGATVEGKITHRLPPKEKAEPTGAAAGVMGFLFYIFYAILSFLAALATGLVLVALLPKAVAESTRSLKEGLWKSLGIGFVALIIVPVAAVILMITMVGLPLGLISLGLYIAFIYLSHIFFGIFIGERILVAITKNEEMSPYWSLLLGLVLLAVVGMIPFLGWLVNFVAMLFGLGALVLVLFGAIGRGRVPAAPQATEA